MAELTTGDSFGELALIQKAPRQATVITLTPTQVIVLDKPTYDSVIKNVQTSQISMITEFLSHLPSFQSLKKDRLERVAAKF